MKRYSSIILLSVLLTTMIVFLLRQSEPTHTLISTPKVHSYYYSDKTESIPIHLLTTQPQHYYYNPQYISSCKIYDDTSQLSFDVYDVSYKEIDYTFSSEIFQQVTLFLKPLITLTNTVIQLEDATLHITYDNGEELQVLIGEFSYVFDASFNEDITLGHLSATYHSNQEYPTVSGINLSLTNNTDSIITIQHITIVSSSVIANTRYLIERDPCDKHTPVKDCLGVTNYNPFTSPQVEQMSQSLRENHTLDIYIPLSFKKIRHVERFVIKIEYLYHGDVKQIYIDDFPFVQTNPYQLGYEEEYVVYDLD